MILKEQAELIFSSLAQKIYRNPRKYIAAIAVFTLGLASQIFYISFDASVEGFLDEQDPSILKLNETKNQFGRGDFILLTVETENVFDLEFLTQLKKLHEQLEERLPWLHEINSLITARDTLGTEDGLIIGELFQPFPESEEQLANIKERALENPLLINLLVSDNYQFTTLVIEPLTYDQSLQSSLNSDDSFDSEIDSFDELDIDELGIDDFDSNDLMIESSQLKFLPESKISEIIRLIEKIVPEYESESFKIYLGGAPVVTDKLTDTMIKEMLTFMPMVVVTIVFFLSVLFRRIPGIALPMVTVLFSLLTTVGLLCAFRLPVQMTMMIIPTFILTVTIGDAIHLLTIYFREYDSGKSKKESLILAMSDTGLPMLLTSLTTAAGLLSFIGTPLVAISRLGLFSAFGVMLAFAYTIIIVPALISIIPHSRRDSMNNAKSLVDGLLNKCVHLSTGFPKVILCFGAILLAMAVTGILKLQFSHNPLLWMPENLEARKAIETIDSNMGGSIPVEIVIDSGIEDGVHKPELLKEIDKLSSWLEEYETEDFSISKVTGIHNIIKESHKALNEGKSEYYKISDSEEVIAQEFFLFQNAGPDELQPVVDSQFQKTRLAVVMPWIDTVKYQPFLRDISDYFDNHFNAEAEIDVTGVVPLLGKTLYSVIRTMAQSYLVAFAVIAFMMVVLLGSVKYGLLAMIPNLLPITLMLGLMHWLSIPLDMFTILVASIAIGIAVDDTVHFMYHYRKYYIETGNPHDSVSKTLESTGRAMVTTSIVLCLGFAMLMASSMNNIENFGLLTSTTILLALFADFLLAPAIMVLVSKPIGKRS